MSKVYLNTKTGEVWKSDRYLRKPPAGYQDTGIDIDYRYTKRYVIETVFCPECREYHYWGQAGRYTVPVEVQEYFSVIKEKGCSYADKIFKNSYTRYICTRKDFERYIALFDIVGSETLEKISDEIYKLGLTYEEEERIGRKILTLLARNYLQKNDKT